MKPVTTTGGRGAAAGRGRRLLQLNSTHASVTGHFNLAQALDSLALQYNMSTTQLSRLFQQWMHDYNQNFGTNKEKARALFRSLHLTREGGCVLVRR